MDLVGVIEQDLLLFVNICGPILTISLESEIGDWREGTEMNQLSDIQSTDAFVREGREGG
jgi:hypothetical protein